jgi:hypothetical protein
MPSTGEGICTAITTTSPARSHFSEAGVSDPLPPTSNFMGGKIPPADLKTPTLLPQLAGHIPETSCSMARYFPRVTRTRQASQSYHPRIVICVDSKMANELLDHFALRN